MKKTLAQTGEVVRRKMGTDELLQRALDKWGYESQLDMVIEECAELIHAIQKHRRGRATKEQVIEEVVDVSLMLKQLRMMMPMAEVWYAFEDEKLKRLEGRLDEK